MTTRKRKVKGKRDSRKRGKSTQSDSQNLLREQARVFDISQDAIFFWRVGGSIEFWNRGAAELYGYKSHEALGQNPHELLRTNFPVQWREIERELRSGGSWKGELRQLKRNGEEIVVSARLQRVADAEKKMLVLESTRDITGLKRDEEMLARRLREQATVAQFSLDALQATNIQNICDDATHILARELGTDYGTCFECMPDGETMILRSAFGFPPSHVDVTQIKINEQTAMGRAVHLNRPIIITDWRKDKHLRLPEFMRDQKVISSMAVVIQGPERAFGGLGVSSKKPRSFGPDEMRFLESIGNVLAAAISRIQFEKEFRDTAARLKAIVDTAVDGIITINQRGIVETMNPAAQRIFGYKAEEVIGRNVSMLMPEPYHSEHDRYLQHYLDTGERRIIGIGREVRGLRKNGTDFPLDLAVSATNLGHRRIFTGLVRDITARRRLEQELLETSDREQRRIGSDLHDDLCQRLAGIRFGCDVLKKTLPRSTPDHVSERIEKIGFNVSDAIDRTRMLARGMAPVALEANGLASALQELTSSVQKLFTIKCIFLSKEPVSVSDPIAATHLYRIAQESLNNSLKHANASELIISLGMRDSKAVLSIEDNGIGFSTPEARVSAQGMGLRTIVYRAGMIDAGVQVQSEPGKGTKIICTFSPKL